MKICVPIELRLVLSRPEGCHICAVYSFFGGIQRHVASITTENTANQNTAPKPSLFLLRFWEVCHAVFWPYFLRRWPSLQNLTLRLNLFKDKTYFKKVIYWEGFKFILTPISNSKIHPDLPSCLSRRGLCALFYESVQNMAPKIRRPPKA